jgi:uncharacterized protein YndB with AHSA1/START domain
MAGTDGDGDAYSVSGTYRAVHAPRLIEFTWRHDWSEESDEPETLVRYELSESGGVTNLTVTHSGFTSVADREDHVRGWKIVLGWVRDFATTRT